MKLQSAFLIALAGLVATLSGCPGDDDDGTGGGTSTGSETGGGGAGGDAGPAWRTVLDDGDLDRAALSVWGSSKDSVFVVGGPLGNTPFQALAIHYDGTSWTDLKPGGDDTFWWVHGTSANDVWMSGENGRIAHWDGAQFDEHTSGTTATVWGVYAFGASDVWAVAGTPGGGAAAPNDIVLRYDGSAWMQEVLPDMPLGVAHYKVWGPSADDVYVVGEAGTIWHYQAGTWTNESVMGMGTLFTVWGCSASEIYAVGGQRVLKSSGDGTWTEQTDIELTNQVNGVSCAGSDIALVGAGGLKQRNVDGSWLNEFDQRPFDDFHAVWAAGDGELWIVGGDFVGSPTPNAERPGVVGRYGPGEVADAISP